MITPLLRFPAKRVLLSSRRIHTTPPSSQPAKPSTTSSPPPPKGPPSSANFSTTSSTSTAITLTPALSSSGSGRSTPRVISLLHAYGRSQKRRPWLTQLLTAMSVYALGDLTSQLLFPQPNGSYSPLRTARMVTVGAIFAVPWHEWYSFLSRLFPRYPPMVAICLRVAINQLIFTPPFLVAFFGLQGLLAGMSLKEVKEKIITAVPASFEASCKVWPLVSALNFALVPFEFRALVGGVVSLGWNCFLSWVNTRAEQVVELGEEAHLRIEVKKEEEGAVEVVREVEVKVRRVVEGAREKVDLKKEVHLDDGFGAPVIAGVVAGEVPQVA